MRTGFGQWRITGASWQPGLKAQGPDGGQLIPDDIWRTGWFVRLSFGRPRVGTTGATQAASDGGMSCWTIWGVSVGILACEIVTSKAGYMDSYRANDECLGDKCIRGASSPPPCLN